MCVMSMVMQFKHDEWWQRYYAPLGPSPYVPPPVFVPPCIIPHPPQKAPYPTQTEIDEFHRLLDRAREYDRMHGQPFCEQEEKRKKLKDMAEQLGVKIDFV